MICEALWSRHALCMTFLAPPHLQNFNSNLQFSYFSGLQCEKTRQVLKRRGCLRQSEHSGWTTWPLPVSGNISPAVFIVKVKRDKPSVFTTLQLGWTSEGCRALDVLCSSQFSSFYLSLAHLPMPYTVSCKMSYSQIIKLEQMPFGSVAVHVRLRKHDCSATVYYDILS